MLFIFVAALSLLVSCAKDLSRIYPTTVSEYGSILDRHAMMGARLETDRRIFEFELRRGLFSVEGDGVFLYQKPERMRLDLYVGTTELVFQYLRNGEDACVVLPAEERIIASEEGWVVLGGIEGMEEMKVRDDELRSLMLGVIDFPGDSEGLSEVREGKRGYLVSLPRDNEVSYVFLDRETYLLSDYLVLSDGRKVREIKWSSFEKVNGIDRPRSATYKDESLGLTVKVSIRSETVNEHINSSLFSLPPGWVEP